MELRQLRYFVAVAETGNISRAAKKIFLTQPALSRQIKALEEEIGQCLLERRAQSIRLTPQGERLLPEARELLQHADEMLQRIQAAEQAQRLRVGYAPSLASGLLSAAVGSFTQKHPGARVELFDLSTSEMIAGLNDRTLEVAVTAGLKSETSGLRWMPLVRATWKLAVGGRHPLARRQQVAPADVAREPLLVYCQRDYPEYWATINAWFKSHQLRPKIAGEYDGADSLLAAVASGQGVALVTTRTAHLFPNRARLKSLISPPDPLCIAAGYRADQKDHKPLAVFLEELRESARDFAGTIQ